MRGQRKLFDLFGEQPEQRTDEQPRNYFLPLRDEALCHRFYWHADVNKYKFEEVLKQLNNEFYLSNTRIIKVLDDNYDTLNCIQKNKPSTKELQLKYPHFTWMAR